VLSGHAHDYERFAPQAPDGAADDVRGIRQFVVGTGGRNLQILGALQPNSEVLQNTSFGVLKLVLHPTSYDWQFLPTPGGTFTDSGSRACGGQDIEPPTAPTGLTATATNSAQVDLAWGRSTDNVGVTGYRVYRDHAQVGTTVGSQTAYVDTTAAPATTYIYEVTAIDAAGRRVPGDGEPGLDLRGQPVVGGHRRRTGEPARRDHVVERGALRLPRGLRHARPSAGGHLPGGRPAADRARPPECDGAEQQS